MGQRRQVFTVTGADHVKFLQSLVTNDVEKAQKGLVYTALLTPQGKYLFDFFMQAQGDHMLIDCDADQAEALKGRLMLYKLRADVAIEPANLHVHRGLSVAAADFPDDAQIDPRNPALGWRAYRDHPQTDGIDWAARRVAHMVPQAGAELITGDSYILEMNFEALNGVDFRKGCYVGQEVTARMKHKTELRKGLVRVIISGETEFGDDITSAGKTVGQILTRSGNKALAYVRLDRIGDEMQSGDATVRLDQG